MDDKKEAVQAESIFTQYATDEVAEVEGVWVNDFRPGFDVLVARLGNPKYRANYARRSRPFRGQIDRGTLSEEKHLELTVEAMVDTVFLDFRGDAAKKPDGGALPRTRETRVDLLTNLKDFRDDMVWLSREAETFKQQELEDAAGNSREPSDTSSGGKGSTTKSGKASSAA